MGDGLIYNHVFNMRLTQSEQSSKYILNIIMVYRGDIAPAQTRKINMLCPVMIIHV